MKAVTHPYNYSEDKNVFQRLIDIGVPVGLFWVYFQFYNFAKITPSEMIKTAGLLAIALLSLTLIIGPICKLFPSLDMLKAHRKFWGILSFFITLAHIGLIIVYFYKFDLTKLFITTNPKFLGLMIGLIALGILFVVTISSIKVVLNYIPPKIWKIIQSLSYLALIFALLHFYLVESTNGVLVIKRLLGQITFGFALLTVLLRFIILLFWK